MTGSSVRNVWADASWLITRAIVATVNTMRTKRADLNWNLLVFSYGFAGGDTVEYSMELTTVSVLMQRLQSSTPPPVSGVFAIARRSLMQLGIGLILGMPIAWWLFLAMKVGMGRLPTHSPLALSGAGGGVTMKRRSTDSPRRP
jgi:hypothetical protein